MVKEITCWLTLLQRGNELHCVSNLLSRDSRKRLQR